MGIYAPSFSNDEVCEVQDSLSENFDDDGISCSVKLHCPYSIRHDVVADIVGANEFWPHGSFEEQQPFAISASIVPFGGKTSQDGQCLVYEKAEITVNYEAKGRDSTESASESIEPTAEFQRLDYRHFCWKDTDGPPLTENQAPSKLLRGMNIVRNIFKWPPPLPTELLDRIGSVNSAAYSSGLLGLTFPAESLLYCPPTMQRSITTGGIKTWNVTLKFMVKPEGWNKFWREDAQEWQRLFNRVADAEYNNYPLQSFAAFFA